MPESCHVEDLSTIWTAWSPEVRAEVLQVKDAEVAQLLEQRMRLLWAGEMQARQFGMQSPDLAFDQTKLRLVATMQFHTGVSFESSSMVCQRVSWPQDFHHDPTVVSQALGSSAAAAPAHVHIVGRLVHVLQPAATNWTDFEKQIVKLVEQLVMKAHTDQKNNSGEGNGRTAPSTNCQSTASKPQTNGTAAKHQPTVMQLDEKGEDDSTIAPEVAEEDAAAGVGRAAKRARQRERRRMFKAAAREAAADENGDASVTNGTGAHQSFGAAPPGKWSALPADSPVQIGNRGLQANLSADPARIDAGADLVPQGPIGIHGATAGASVGRGAGGRRPPAPSRGARDQRDVAFVAQPPNIWEPARIVMKDDAPDLGGRALDDEDIPELEDVIEPVVMRPLTIPDSQPRKIEADDVSDLWSPGAFDFALLSPQSSASPAASRTPSVDELSSLVEKLLVKEDTNQATDPWSGRPVGALAPLMGVGRGKPMNGEEPQARFGDDFAGMGMGRGRRLAPPPGIGGSSSRGLRAPGGLSKEWRPEPPIPEEELDQDENEASIKDWSSSLEVPSHLFMSAASTRLTDDDLWSKASYGCATPSMAWSKTPSPPGTPLLLSRGIPDWSQLAMPPGYGELHLPSNMMHTGPVGHGFHGSHGIASIPVYVTVPVATTHSCPHCGRAFALPEPHSPGQSASANNSPSAHKRST